MTPRIVPNMRVRHIVIEFGEGIVLSTDDTCSPPTAVVRWEDGRQSSITIGMLEAVPAYAAGGEL